MRKLIFLPIVLLALAASWTIPSELHGQEPEAASPVPPPDDPRRPQQPPGVDTGRNPLWLALGSPLLLLDHIFYNDWLRPTGWEVRPTMASDHHTLTAEFEFAR